MYKRKQHRNKTRTHRGFFLNQHTNKTYDEKKISCETTTVGGIHQKTKLNSSSGFGRSTALTYISGDFPSNKTPGFKSLSSSVTVERQHTPVYYSTTQVLLQIKSTFTQTNKRNKKEKIQNSQKLFNKAGSFFLFNQSDDDDDDNQH